VRFRCILKFSAVALAAALSSLVFVPTIAAQEDGNALRGGTGGTLRGGSRLDPGPPTPRLPDGKPNLGRTQIGKGAWLPRQIWGYDQVMIDPAREQGIPYQPWSKALRHYRQVVTESRDDPQGFCIPPGGPRVHTTMFPMEIIQLPEQQRIIQILEGGGHVWREIYMDGRPHPESFDGTEWFPSFLGHSIGHWEGDTLVVDTVGFNEGTWIDGYGDPHTDQLHLIERYSRPGVNVLRYEATIDDPGAYTRPWTIAFEIPWSAEAFVKEYICQENNRWQENYVLAKNGEASTGNVGADMGHGHPVKGTFLGEWGPNANARHDVVVLMDWDGKAITGEINPGPAAAPFTRAELNPEDWSLHIEAEGNGVKYVLDGKFDLERLGYLTRVISGTWVQGNQRGDFKLTRQK
jgi:hypothetical protein